MGHEDCFQVKRARSTMVTTFTDSDRWTSVRQEDTRVSYPKRLGREGAVYVWGEGVFVTLLKTQDQCSAGTMEGTGSGGKKRDNVKQGPRRIREPRVNGYFVGSYSAAR